MAQKHDLALVLAQQNWFGIGFQWFWLVFLWFWMVFQNYYVSKHTFSESRSKVYEFLMNLKQKVSLGVTDFTWVSKTLCFKNKRFLEVISNHHETQMVVGIISVVFVCKWQTNVTNIGHQSRPQSNIGNNNISSESSIKSLNSDFGANFLLPVDVFLFSLNWEVSLWCVYWRLLVTDLMSMFCV